MRGWEQDRIAKVGDGVSFFTISDNLEEYFESLRILAGEPADGTTGRVLPKYEKAWIDAFQRVVAMRNRWWDQERRKAEAADCSNHMVEGSLLMEGKL
jgi:hypothetical protein